MTDPITDMLNRIRNAQAVLHQTAEIPFSGLKYEIAKILEKEKFVGAVEKKGGSKGKIIKINLKYQKEKSLQGGKKTEPIICGLKKISKPGQRIYLTYNEIKAARGGIGIAIISTSKGLMTDKEAKKKKIGGEVICRVW